MSKKVLLFLVPTSVQDYHFKGYAGVRARVCVCARMRAHAPSLFMSCLY